MVLAARLPQVRPHENQGQQPAPMDLQKCVEDAVDLVKPQFKEKDITGHVRRLTPVLEAALDELKDKHDPPIAVFFELKDEYL